MKKLALIVILSSCGYLYAQEESSLSDVEITDGEKPYEWSFKEARKVIKSRPFDFFNALPCVAADFELGGFAGKYVGFQWGLGYYPNYLQPFSGSTSDQLFDNMSGYLVRFEPRFYIWNSKKHYLASEFSVRHLRIADEVSVGMEGDGEPWDPWQNFAYFVKEDMIFHRFSGKMTIKYGWNWQLRSGIVFDFYGGLSFRFNYVYSNSDVPQGGVVQPRWNALNWSLENGYLSGYPIPIFGVSIGYAIKK
ncbi:hypothetical protein JYT74_00160 [Crocinitomix catalasitica]|nr:hypothetical protein [Crocinitomix catalasitica]